MSKDFRIIFMGTPEFAVPSLSILIENGYHIAGVITASDKPAGRGRNTQESAVKQYAKSQNLTILQPTNLKDEVFIEELQALNGNLQIVVAFRMLPEVVWQMPEFGTFNLHASLLPNYRGAAPINWAIINGEKTTGITTFYINERIDTGDILMQEEVDIGPHDSAGTLHDSLQIKGATLVLSTVQGIANDSLEEQSQNDNGENGLKPAPKIYKEDCKLDWSQDADQLFNKIRGLSPYPGAWTILVDNDGNEQSLKIFEAELSDNMLLVGSIETDNSSYLLVGTSNGSIALKSVQLAGKKRNSIADFLRGFDLDKKWRF
ncbi:MAG: methionyl-tRNA formyltransferase [Bacteroidetes bacterium]|nr:MAG: methionyl-tRNA formyltransferase [Bacteroidota bacterium]